MATSSARLSWSFVLFGLTAAACASKADPIRPAPDAVASAGNGGAAGQPGATGTAGKDAAAGQAGAPAKDCPEGVGPAMVRIELPDTPAYCIDSTEVTQGQYAKFVGAAVEPAKQKREYCRLYNKSFTPAVKGDHVEGCDPGVYDPDKKGDIPVSCVQFCDAVAYCEWAGKRLCGAIGGGVASSKDVASKQSQWYMACSQGGKTKYPYGDTYEPGKCDNRKEGPPYGLHSASESSCGGTGAPFEQIKDLSGSVAEWEDSEQTPYGFFVRGSYRDATDDNFSCDAPSIAAGIQTLPDIGFRCCADL